MIRIAQCKCSIHDTRAIEQLAADYLKIPADQIRQVHIRKRSIDAREKQNILYVYCLDVEASNEKNICKRMEKKGVTAVQETPYHFPSDRRHISFDLSCGSAEGDGSFGSAGRPVIVGAGPAGLFAAYELALQGFRPILLERGREMSVRRQDVNAFWNGGELNPESNVQFGEGGAGTFSDGKLNSMIKDPTGRIRHVLETFVRFGADPAILYDNKPHLGTDVLAVVIPAMRQCILEHGGQILFESRLTGFAVKNQRLKAVIYETHGETKELSAEHCILAIGHSARDTFQMLSASGLHMEPKAFAVGFRMEHPQNMIQTSQYGAAGSALPAASYKLTAQTSLQRGVYSFCMCPGGMIVNASSEKGFLAVNGMSCHARDRRNANSAIVVTIQPSDFIAWNRDCRLDSPESARKLSGLFAGMAFQRIIEKRAYEQAQGKVPVQLYGDFCRNTPSTTLGDVIPDICGGYQLSNVRRILPEELNQSIQEGIAAFGRRIHGFDREDAVLAGVESRTSSPVRILRDDSLQSNIHGIYPCGEGAGYAGGITSAAIDGIKVAERIVLTK